MATECAIGGYHGQGQNAEAHGCELCGAPVCLEHRGIHWERAHRANATPGAGYTRPGWDDLPGGGKGVRTP